MTIPLENVETLHAYLNQEAARIKKRQLLNQLLRLTIN